MLPVAAGRHAGRDDRGPATPPWPPADEGEHRGDLERRAPAERRAARRRNRRGRRSRTSPAHCRRRMARRRHPGGQRGVSSGDAALDVGADGVDVGGQQVAVLGRSNRSARWSGSTGRTPVACSTASGNLAGWAVAMRPAPPRRPAPPPPRRRPPPCAGRPGSRCAGTGRRSRRGGPVVEAGGHEAGIGGRSTAPTPGSGASARRWRRRRFSSSSNSRRSWLDDTWMSMLGLSVGTTPSWAMSPVAAQRVRMSLLFRPMISRSMGAPARRAIQPAKTLPKLPVGTATSHGPAARRPPGSR